MTRVSGVDGCRGGWFIVSRNIEDRQLSSELLPSFQDVIFEKSKIIAVDIPIGFLGKAQKGGRACDKQAREVLGWPRQNSIFSPPVRGALECLAYEDALKANKRSSPEGIGISRQSFGLISKLREADALMTPSLQRRVRESHPELCFTKLNGKPIKQSKKTPEGSAIRKRLLKTVGFEEVILNVSYPRSKVQPDDILDACVLCWMAERIVMNEAKTLPSDPARDSKDLRMEIWF